MIVKEMENTCIVCGKIIPEGKLVCPMCGTTESDVYGKFRMNLIQPEPFTVKDEVEQAYRQGFEAGMKHSCEIKTENERLKREIAFLKGQLESRLRIDDMDGEYE